MRCSFGYCCQWRKSDYHLEGLIQTSSPVSLAVHERDYGSVHVCRIIFRRSVKFFAWRLTLKTKEDDDDYGSEVA